MKKLMEKLAASVACPGTINRVAMGLHWIAVMVGGRCGLASSLYSCRNPEIKPSVPEIDLEGSPAREAVDLLKSEQSAYRVVGMATLNACLEVAQEHLIEENAFDLLARKGKGKRVVIVGHFPGVARLRGIARDCQVLELSPGEGDIPAASAPEVLPSASVVGLSSTTLLNGTFKGLMEHIRPEAFVAMIGPSTPLSPVLFQYGVDVLGGTLVQEMSEVIEAVEAGASFQDLKPYTRLVTLSRDSTRE